MLTWGEGEVEREEGRREGGEGGERSVSAHTNIYAHTTHPYTTHTHTQVFLFYSLLLFSPLSPAICGRHPLPFLHARGV